MESLYCGPHLFPCKKIQAGPARLFVTYRPCPAVPVLLYLVESNSRRFERNMSRGNSLSDELELSSVLGDTRAYLYDPVWG